MNQGTFSDYHLYGYGGWDRDFTIPFVGSSYDTGLNVDGRECGLFHTHVGMAGNGVYAFTGSQTIIGGTLHLAIGMALS